MHIKPFLFLLQILILFKKYFSNPKPHSHIANAVTMTTERFVKLIITVFTETIKNAETNFSFKLETLLFWIWVLLCFHSNRQNFKKKTPNKARN